MLQGTKLQNSTQYDEFQKKQMKIRQHVRQTRTNSVKIQVGMSADSMQGRGGGEGKTKGGEDH